ncbi:tyrosine-type recombinase/integrase [Bacillus sp. E(2018)]|uniref:tyrosine-type recombinase/integrase n=1 Tax=Bacillus sp. E(2018) TaxID=2502239 RepID=UPI0010F638D2
MIYIGSIKVTTILTIRNPFNIHLRELTTDSKLVPHKLRHTYATNIAEETGDISLVMNQLGHTSSQTSLLYITTTREKARKASELST